MKLLQGINGDFLKFTWTPFGTEDNGESPELVRGSLSAKFNQHGSLVFSECL
jgi:hypothetical protein